MNRFTYPIFVSLIIHLSLFFILINILSSGKNIKSQFQLVMKKNVPYPICLETKSPQQIQVTDPIKTANQNSVTANKEIILPDSTEHVVTTTREETPPFEMIKKMQQDIFFSQARQKEKSKAQHIDSLFQLFTSGISTSSQEKPDAIPDSYLNRDIGTIQASLIPPPEHKEKVHKTNYDYIPSIIQLYALTILDCRQTLDQTNLYLQIKQDQSMTIETFLKEMDELYINGFVKRNKISPQQLFNFFGAPIETNSKNRKNPVFSYSMQIDRTILKHSLESEIDQYSTKQVLCKSDSIRLEQLKSKLKIIRLNYDNQP